MFKKGKMSSKDVLSVVDGLKKIYVKKIQPVEELYRFADFHSPVMRDCDFEAKPMVLLLGQYSTGKTTFIQYLLQKKFPGSHIGPEPTTGLAFSSSLTLAIYFTPNVLLIPRSFHCCYARRGENHSWKWFAIILNYL